MEAPLLGRWASSWSAAACMKALQKAWGPVPAAEGPRLPVPENCLIDLIDAIAAMDNDCEHTRMSRSDMPVHGLTASGSLCQARILPDLCPAGPKAKWTPLCTMPLCTSCALTLSAQPVLP